MAIRSWATQSALVDPSVAVTSAAIQIWAIQIWGIPIVATRSAAIQSVADRDAMGEVQNVVILFEALNAARNAATPNAVLSVVQDVARGVVLRSAVTQSVRYAVDQRAVDQCAAYPNAMVDSRDEVLPNDGQGVSPVDLLSLAVVQSADARDASLFSVPALS